MLLDQSEETSPGATMAAWVYPTSAAGGNQFVISSDNGGYDWSLLRTNNDHWALYDGQSLFDSGLSVQVNQWQYLAATFDLSSKKATLYIFYLDFFDLLRVHRWILTTAWD